MNPIQPAAGRDWRPWTVAGLLLLAALAVYWPVTGYEFISLDDPVYVTDNQRVQQGLTPANVWWAFTTIKAEFWHPLTWLSHMLDCQIHGLNAGGHHLTNLLLHLANTLLLFAVLRRMTGALWRSALVAALFALHPLHVESVAWVAERKDVLSTFFWMLTLWAYTRYVEESKDQSPKSKVWYSLALGFFALGLMAKPMLVTLPFVLLLLDYWPLCRFDFSTLNLQPSTLVRRAREKVPLLALAVGASALAFSAQASGGTVPTLSQFPLGARISNALVAYVGYLRKLMWPDDLAVYYPLPIAWSGALVIGTGLFLLIVTIIVIRRLRRQPALAVGWFWYLGTLVPVIGLVQVGAHAMADRYTYVPLIGVFLMIIWGAGDCSVRWRHRKTLLMLASGLMLGGCAVLARIQVQYWRNNEALFAHAVAVTSNAEISHANLAHALLRRGQYEEAIVHFGEVVRINPRSSGAHHNWGNALGLLGRYDEAIAHYAEAVRLKPDFAEAHCNWGNALVLQGQFAEAQRHFLEALRLKPDYAETRIFQGNLLVLQGRIEEAITRYLEAVKIEPHNAEGHYYLGGALARQRDFAAATAQLRLALKFNPNYATAANDLAWILATETNTAIRNVDEAIRLATRACELTTNQEALYLDTLAAAYAESGRFAEAMAAAQQAVTVARAVGDAALAARLEQQLIDYRERRPGSSSLPPAGGPDQKR